MGIKARLEMPGSSTDAEADVGRIRTVLTGFSEMLAVPKRLGSARVPMCNFRRPGRKTLFGETPNTHTRGRVCSQTYSRNRGLSMRFSEMTCGKCSKLDNPANI